MKKKIAVLGNGWTFDFSNSVIEGIKETIGNSNVDIYYFSCYKFHNPDKSINITGYYAYDTIDFTNFDGVIVLANLIEDENSLLRITKKIIDSKIPAISLVRALPGLSYIHVDNYIGYYNLINHLLDEHKLTKLGFIGGIKNDVQSEERFKAFSQALKEHNLEINNNFIIQNTDWSFKAGYENGKILLQKKEIPQAIVCSNDSLALGVIRAAYEFNISIPDDIKIIGFDNNAVSATTIPSISTVNTNSKEMGKIAAQLILSNDTTVHDIKIDTLPVIRQSCGCCKEFSEAQLTSSIRNLYVQDEEERFSTHLRHTEAVFINDNNVAEFWDSCKNFFVSRHDFEGENFSLLLRKELIDSIKYENFEFNLTSNFTELITFINMQDGKITDTTLINASDYVPKNLLSNNSSVFLFIPFVYRNNLLGYYVAKDNLKLLYNKRGYSWSKNLANSIEKFCEKTKYKLLSQKYLGLSTRDTLSGLYNRAAIDLFANELYETNRHSNDQTIIYFIDINCLKKINDKHGHLHGDFVIKIIAEEIKNSIPDKWIPIRYGGDEFVVIGTYSEKEAEIFNELNNLLKEKQRTLTLPYDLSVSIGSIIIPSDATLPLEEQINKADNEMYKNKQIFHQNLDSNVITFLV